MNRSPVALAPHCIKHRTKTMEHACLGLSSFIFSLSSLHGNYCVNVMHCWSSGFSIRYRTTTRCIYHLVQHLLQTLSYKMVAELSIYKPAEHSNLSHERDASEHSAARKGFNAGISRKRFLKAFSICSNKWQKSPRKSRPVCMERASWCMAQLRVCSTEQHWWAVLSIHYLIWIITLNSWSAWFHWQLRHMFDEDTTVAAASVTGERKCI